MADSMTEAVTSAPAGEPGVLAARGKDALETRPKDNRHALHNGAPMRAVLPHDVLAFLEVAMPGTIPADAAGGTPVMTVVQEANVQVPTVSQITKEPTHAPEVKTQVTQKQTGESQETSVHKKVPAKKQDTSSVGLSPEVLSFLDITLYGVAEPEISEESSPEAPVTPDSPDEPHVTKRVTQATSPASVEPKQSSSVENKLAMVNGSCTVATLSPEVMSYLDMAMAEWITDEVVVQEIAEEAATARQEIPLQIPEPAAAGSDKVSTTVQAEETAEPTVEVDAAEVEVVDMEEVSEVAVEDVNMAQEVVHQVQLAAVETIPEAQEDEHKEQEAPKAEVEDIASTKRAEPEGKPALAGEPATKVEESTTQGKEPATEVTESTAEVKESASDVKKPAKEAKESATEVTEPATEVTEPAAATEVTEPAKEVKEPTKEVKESMTEVDKPATEDSTGEVKVPATQVTESATEVTEPVTEKSATKVTEPVTEVTEPVTEVTEPVTEVTEPVTEVTEPVTEVTEPVTEVTEPVKEAEAVAVTDEPVTEDGKEPEKAPEVAVEAAPTAEEDRDKKAPVAANTEWTEEQVKEWSQQGYLPMVKNMFLPSTMPVLPSPLFYIGVGGLASLVFYLTESPIMALMTLVFVLVLILLARLFYLYRLHGQCAAESANKKKSE
ncbi:retinitis pigmentosa 1-like 1 protein isoform X2 [Branchiostoma floridae]|uniref:Retinitis pigmentosa 1-like 1 protein isoform X2 n=1 Tax=Branchiostoma floridae TaxID=7739 RepID=A0A9J7LC80_BRAFL|nr:retinitis pigmentosa 1-like 1 protein isoform X2 [Branchiostoma floridae]